MRITRTRLLTAAAAMASTVFLLICTGVSAQGTKPAATTAPASAAPATAPAATPATATAPAAKPFKEEELASLLAPIALYPDTVVAQILMASTYPLEVVEAHRWADKNKQLKGEALATEAKKQSWDQSVQALTAFPDVLKMMDEKLDWTQKLGDAFLAQQTEVMAMVQTLRKKAKDAGNLKSDEHQKVKVEPAPATTGATATTAAAPSTTTIVIEPTDPQVVYVPTYSPTYAYGAWAYPSYPPYYYYPPAYYPATGFWWGVSVGVAIGVWGGAWNNNCDWNGGNVNINTGDVNIGSGNRGDRGDRGNAGGGNSNWKHNPEHRKGASYRDSATAQKYNRGSSASASTRDSYRGRSGAGTGASAGTRDLGGGSGASAGTRDLGGGSGASAGTRDLGGGSGASAGTRDMGGGSRSGTSASSRGSSSSAFGGSSSGSRASSYSSRGGSSRGGGGMSRGGGGRRR
jgi:hypothetical protein